MIVIGFIVEFGIASISIAFTLAVSFIFMMYVDISLGYYASRNAIRLQRSFVVLPRDLKYICSESSLLD